jgi:Ni/Fe-hydrogenase 1 B-type cytochrome subunit
MEANIETQRKVEFGAAYRWQHWIRAVSIVALTITGFYLAMPFVAPAVNAEPTNFMNALFRSWHMMFGFALVGVILFKFYLFVFTKRYREEMNSIKDFINIKTWAQTLGYYMFLTKHPELKGTYNPLQFMAYIVFYLFMIVLIITGLVLYVHSFHGGLGGVLYDTMRNFEVMMGGLAWTRELHHIAMWGVILFVTVHIYMAIYNSIFRKEGSIDAIFSGLKWHEKRNK